MLSGKSTTKAKTLTWLFLQVWNFGPYIYNCLVPCLPQLFIIVLIYYSVINKLAHMSAIIM